ncbi:MAG: carboxylating nicotinate-nucleotide diphosphorylase [Acidobacteriota bacterium]
MELYNLKVDKIIEDALEEDIAEGDITTDSIVPEDSKSKASIIAKEKGILAGIEIGERVFLKIDKNVVFNAFFKDGDLFNPEDKIAEVIGKTKVLLKGERVALNFLQRLSGIATITRSYVDKCKNYRAKIMDTRKTTPGLRALEKYAVKMGGGENHRYNLSQMILIKENHIFEAGGISEAVLRARNKNPLLKIEVEVKNFNELNEALKHNPDIIMLDNWKVKDIKRAVEIVKKKVPIEVSGNVNLDNIEEIASTGVDFISVGKLTHSYKSIDMSMIIEEKFS